MIQTNKSRIASFTKYKFNITYALNGKTCLGYFVFICDSNDVDSQQSKTEKNVTGKGNLGSSENQLNLGKKLELEDKYGHYHSDSLNAESTECDRKTKKKHKRHHSSDSDDSRGYKKKKKRSKHKQKKDHKTHLDRYEEKTLGNSL